MAIVGIKNFKVVANKFIVGLLYSIVVMFVIVAMSYIGGGGLPPVYAVYGSLIYALLEAFLKFFRQYKPAQYDEFKWIYEVIIEGIKEFIASKKL